MTAETPAFSDGEKLIALKREIALRKNLYRKWVENGRMKAHDADIGIAIMAAIATDYEQRIAARREK